VLYGGMNVSDAWDTLYANSTITSGDAWEHLEHQGTGDTQCSGYIADRSIDIIMTHYGIDVEMVPATIEFEMVAETFDFETKYACIDIDSVCLT
jgi:hypothetical protein